MDAAILPGLELARLFDWIAQLGFAMLRIGAFLLSSPAFGGRFVPVQVRIIATVALALPVMQIAPLPAPAEIASLAAVPMILAELSVGLAAGLVMTILFGAATTAGDRIASTAGLGFAAQFDPAAGGQTPVVSQLFFFFLLFVFLAGDGHLAALRLLLESYRIAPPGLTPDPTLLIEAGITAGGVMFALAMGVMMPVVSVLLLLNIAVGVVTRSAPQMNIFSFGFPLTMTATLLLLFITAPTTAVSLDALVRRALEAVALITGG